MALLTLVVVAVVAVMMYSLTSMNWRARF